MKACSTVRAPAARDKGWKADLRAGRGEAIPFGDAVWRLCGVHLHPVFG